MNVAPRIGLAAGEASGDRLGALLIERIREVCPRAQFVGIAGPQMRAAGCQAVARSEELSVMGVAEVVRHLPRLLRLRSRVARHFLQQPPGVFLGIDAPDFNLGLEKRLRRHGIRTLHWVSPSVWAWRRYRVRTMRASVEEVLTLFPFEVDFYRAQGVQAHFVGHPLADAIGDECARAAARESLSLDITKPCIALLPGSRAGEVARLLPLFVRTARRCLDAEADLQFVLPAATEALLNECRRWLRQPPFAALQVRLVLGRAHEAMCAADVVLLASGTATLECLLLRRPMVVAYRLHPLTYRLLRRLLKVPYVSLPNILLARAQVPEYLQSAASAERLAPALLALLNNNAGAEQVAPFAGVHRQLRQDSARQVAGLVLQRLGAE